MNVREATHWLRQVVDRTQKVIAAPGSGRSAAGRRVNPRIRAHGRARLDIASRVHTQEDWDALWKEPANPFPFQWSEGWRTCVEYRVDDFPAEVGFFIDLLGFTVEAISPNYAMFTSPDGDFHLAVAAVGGGERGTPPDALRLQFKLAGLEATAAELERRGVVFDSPPVPVETGSSLAIASLRTPHGILMDLWGELAQPASGFFGYDERGALDLGSFDPENFDPHAFESRTFETGVDEIGWVEPDRSWNANPTWPEEADKDGLHGDGREGSVHPAATSPDTGANGQSASRADEFREDPYAADAFAEEDGCSTALSPEQFDPDELGPRTPAKRGTAETSSGGWPTGPAAEAGGPPEAEFDPDPAGPVDGGFMPSSRQVPSMPPAESSPTPASVAASLPDAWPESEADPFDRPSSEIETAPQEDFSPAEDDLDLDRAREEGRPGAKDVPRGNRPFRAGGRHSPWPTAVEPPPGRMSAFPWEDEDQVSQPSPLDREPDKPETPEPPSSEAFIPDPWEETHQPESALQPVWRPARAPASQQATFWDEPEEVETEAEADQPDDPEVEPAPEEEVSYEDVDEYNPLSEDDF